MKVKSEQSLNTTHLDYRDEAPCVLVSFGAGHFCHLQHGHLVSSRFLHPVLQPSQPMAALSLLTFHRSGGLTVSMVTWQSFSQHSVCSDVPVSKNLYFAFFSFDNYNHKQNDLSLRGKHRSRSHCLSVLYLSQICKLSCPECCFLFLFCADMQLYVLFEWYF